MSESRTPGHDLAQPTALIARHNVKWFVWLHLGAVSGLYATALMLGGGLTGPPFPPALGLPVRSELTTHSRASEIDQPQARSDEVLALESVDIRAPWRRETDGRDAPLHRELNRPNE